jgi:hypothetical protein
MLFNRDPRMAKEKTKKKAAWFKKWFGTIASEGRYGEHHSVLSTFNTVSLSTSVSTLVCTLVSTLVCTLAILVVYYPVLDLQL